MSTNTKIKIEPTVNKRGAREGKGEWEVGFRVLEWNEKEGYHLEAE